jgi:hypothetical protein
VPYVSRDLLRLSLKTLQRAKYSPLLIVSVPCMLVRKIPTCRSVTEARAKALPFGGNEETAWLDAYFKVQWVRDRIRPRTAEEWIRHLEKYRALFGRRPLSPHRRDEYLRAKAKQGLILSGKPRRTCGTSSSTTDSPPARDNKP